MLIGLTGGIASGKSTAVRYLKQLGAKIIDSDEIAHKILEPGEEGYKRVVREFGKKILDRQGKIKRRELGRIVFSSPVLLSKLEDLTHPLIIEEIKKAVKILEKKDNLPVILDAPLLFETNLDNMVDEVWVIYVNPEVQLERLLNRDDLTIREAKARISAQMPLERKKELADRVIDNNGTENDLKEQLDAIWLEVTS